MGEKNGKMLLSFSLVFPFATSLRLSRLCPFDPGWFNLLASPVVMLHPCIHTECAGQCAYQRQSDLLHKLDHFSLFKRKSLLIFSVRMFLVSDQAKNSYCQDCISSTSSHWIVAGVSDFLLCWMFALTSFILLTLSCRQSSLLHSPKL